MTNNVPGWDKVFVEPRSNIMPLNQFQNPKMVGSSEYRAIYELLIDCLEDSEGDEDDMIVAVLDEVIEQSLAMRQQVTGSPFVRTCLFVDFSDLCEGCESVSQAFLNNDPDASFGNNNRTMMSRAVMEQELGRLDVDENEIDADELQIIKDRLEALSDGIYIDLEN